jgi:hypothetical protein
MSDPRQISHRYVAPDGFPLAIDGSAKHLESDRVRILCDGWNIDSSRFNSDIAAIGKIHLQFETLYRGPDGRLYIARWDLMHESRYHAEYAGFVMQQVLRRWNWCSIIYVAVELPIVVKTLRGWTSVDVSETEASSIAAHLTDRAHPN